MMIQISSIPVNYDLVVNNTKDNSRTDKNNNSDYYKYLKGFSYPLTGDEAYLLSANTIREMYNRKVLDKMHWNFKETSSDARKDARIGTIKMFENSGKQIPIYVNFDRSTEHIFQVKSSFGFSILDIF